MPERERERLGKCERDKMRYNWSIRLQSSTSVIQRKTFRSVVFILLIIFLKSMLNPTIIVICLFIQIFSLFAYITYLNAHLETKYCKVNMYQIVNDVFKYRLHINKIFNRVWNEFSLSCFLFVYMYIYILFFVCLHTLYQ